MGLVVGLAAGTLILTGAISVYLLIAKGARETAQRARLDQELRAALEVMRSDIRRAGYWDFNDSDAGGDSDGDGHFTWHDLGLRADGSGDFDANGDGLTNDQDLDPLSNPFQRAYGTINADLCVQTDATSGACATATCTLTGPSGDCLTQVARGDCLTFTYDLDLDARIGIRACTATDAAADCPRPGGGGEPPVFAARRGEPFAWNDWYPPQGSAARRDISMEMFGYRRQDAAIAARVGRANGDDNRFGCAVGSWERMTSALIRVSALEFSVETETRNANPLKPPTSPCVSGDLCRQVRSVHIRLTAGLATDPSIQQTLSERVTVRNDRYVRVPGS